jgi:hypothetical protein
MGNVNDFDVSDVTPYKAADGVLKGVAKWGLRKVATNVVAQVLLAIPKMEYRRISAENDRWRAYCNFIKIMDLAAKQRRAECAADELSDTCPMATTISQFYQPGRTTDGTAPLRMYTIIGDDGEVINIQGFDLTQLIRITVMHKNGRAMSENVSPEDALKVLRWLAGLAPAPD